MLPPIFQALTSVIKSPTYNSWQLAREVINGITGLNSQVKSYASQKDIKLKKKTSEICNPREINSSVDLPFA